MTNEEVNDYINKLKEFEDILEGEDVNVETFQNIDKVLGDMFNETLTLTPLKINVKKLHPDAIIPSYSKEGDAGMDLTAVTLTETAYDITFGFGLALEIPKGYVGLIFPRSSIRKYDLLLTNSVGVIDSGYRGEIQATFKKTNRLDSFYKVGERVAQIMIIPYPTVKFNEVDELSDTDRGTGGFGSTGK